MREAASDLTRDAVRFSDGNAVPLCRLVSGEDILMSEDEIVFGNFKMKQFSTNGVQRSAAVFCFGGPRGKLQTANGARAFAFDAAQPQLKRVGELFARTEREGILPNAVMWTCKDGRRFAPSALNFGRRWCRVRGLNSRPTVYKTAALPLS